MSSVTMTEVKTSKKKSSKHSSSSGDVSASSATAVVVNPSASEKDVKRSSKKRKHAELALDPAAVSSVTSHDAPPDAPESTPAAADLDEEVVLSHAAARKKKKAGAKVVEETPEKPSKSSKKTKEDASNAAKKQNSVWVGNLSFKTTQTQVKDFFSGIGVEITRVHMPMKQDGGRQVNRGFAYVDFATPEGQAEAITYSERNLDGRKLLIKNGNDFAGRPASSAVATELVPGEGPTTRLSRFAQKVLKKQSQPPAPTLFMGNLSFDATADSIREFIETHERVRDAKARSRQKDAKAAEGKLAGVKVELKTGEDSDEEEDDGDVKMEDGAAAGEDEKEPSLAKVRVGTFEDSGNCKGFAFLDFRTTQLATAALLDPRNYSMDGRDLKLEYAGADAVRRSGLHPKVSTSTTKTTDGSSRHSKKHDRPARRDDEAAAETAGEGEGSAPPKRARLSTTSGSSYSDRDHSSANKSKQHRLRPGAALAGAQREQTAIVPSQGKRIKF